MACAEALIECSAMTCCVHLGFCEGRFDDDNQGNLI